MRRRLEMQIKYRLICDGGSGRENVFEKKRKTVVLLASFQQLQGVFKAQTQDSLSAVTTAPC